ncbi:unnamed protein product [Ixodes pacificus]
MLPKPPHERPTGIRPAWCFYGWRLPIASISWWSCGHIVDRFPAQTSDQKTPKSDQDTLKLDV